MENEEKNTEDTWTHIHFDLGVVNFDAIRDFQRELAIDGITFDSGGTRETFEWHTDWSIEVKYPTRYPSLKEAHPYRPWLKGLTDLLDEKGIAHTTVEVPKHN